jgi:hypothetical protein
MLRGVAIVNAHTPAVHGVVPLCTDGPAIEIATVALSPAAVPHVPPSAVTFAFVEYGNVRGVPLTLVAVTAGAAVSIVIVRGVLVPVLPSVSLWLAVTVYVPEVDNAGEVVYVHVPAVHAVEPF